MRRLFIACLLAGFAVCATAAPLRIVSSVKPLQLLVTAVAGAEVDSRVLLPPGFSPHDAQLKPSQWQLLDKAELVVWVGPALEQFLDSALQGRSNVLTLQTLVDPRDLNDPHIWMNLTLISELAGQLRDRLVQLRPQQKALFVRNTEDLLAALREHHDVLAREFAGHKPRYLLPHNGYSHFERHYGLAPAAVLSLHDEQLPGTAHIAALRKRLQADEFDCVFREPQQAARLMSRLLSGVNVPVVPLDPMAADVANDGSGFERYYRMLGEAFQACQQAGIVKLNRE